MSFMLVKILLPLKYYFKTPNIIYKSKIGKTFSLQQQQPLVRLNNRKKSWPFTTSAINT